MCLHFKKKSNEAIASDTLNRLEYKKEISIAKLKSREAKYISKQKYKESKVKAENKIEEIKAHQDKKREKLLSNLLWVVGIISTILIILTSLALSIYRPYLLGIETFDWLSIFSLLLSIVLSIFAIMYTYTSNVQIQEEFKDINKAANEISLSSKEIKRVSKEYEAMHEELLIALKKMPKDVAKEINENSKNEGIADGVENFSHPA